MNFAESQQYLYSLGNEVAAMKLGLENIRTLLTALGEPQTNFLKVQVAGTNGKGSVCAFLDSICRQANIKTGLYTSPHLISITERVKIDGVDISESKFARIATHIRETAENLLADGKLEYRPTFFEQMTAIALVAFAEAKVELAILETGLGGRLDATTAANAEIAAITRIDLDHQEYLGDTIEQIAAEKAAIIRADSIVCVGKQNEIANSVILDHCAKLKVTPSKRDLAKWERDGSFLEFLVENEYFGEVALSLSGEHQAENAALAILISQKLRLYFSLSTENICNGLETAKHPGRIELLQLDNCAVLLDGAHNVAGARALGKYLEVYFSDASIALVYGSMIDKEFASCLRLLEPHVKDLIITEPSNTRSASPELVADGVRSMFGVGNTFIVQDVAQALDSAIQIAENYSSLNRRLVLVTGSLYLVGEVKEQLSAISYQPSADSY